MRRRGVGIGAVRKKQEQAKQFSEVGEQIVEANLSHVSSQLELFRTNLQAFAIKYKNNIKKDPDFRRKFQVMCAKIGVDPLASKKGFWSELLDVGDFYYELAVQIIEVCIITRPKNGGLIGMSDLLRLLEKKRGPAMQTVIDDDVKRAVKKLSVLGEGFQLIDMEERTMVSAMKLVGHYKGLETDEENLVMLQIVTVPVVLSRDHSTILALAQTTGGMVNVSILARELQWDKKRSMLALNLLLREGMMWLDEQTSEPSYFFPSITLSGTYTYLALGMGKPRFVCEYCNKSFEDSHEARQRHNRGRNHKANVKLWYDSFTDQERRTTAAGNSAQRPDAALGNSAWTPVNQAVSDREPALHVELQNLPPSMHPAPPGSFFYCRSDWG
ncbi:Vacuolar-sorting protein SNF8 [Phytophthora citrophthora]|uniref:Vacuolar-sorting protein SNF8 n=1 Tax=Phytophthora citrophthora TaxID=4793 RepID=A0AAD9LF67_9STRA|nr:Vacuolar-sorting protein SNF8 [Phytophthora citrophthora]